MSKPAVVMFLLLLPSSVLADPVVLRTTMAGSILAEAGVPYSGSYYGTVYTAPSGFESRATAEYNADSLRGIPVHSARLDGTVEANGNWNLGPTISVWAYLGNGAYDLSDFSTAAVFAGTFTVPARTWGSSFTLDVTEAVQRLLEQDPAWIGFRYQAVQNGAEPVDIGGHAGYYSVALTVTDVAPVPEPSSLLLLGTGLAGMARMARTRRGDRDRRS